MKYYDYDITHTLSLSDIHSKSGKQEQGRRTKYAFAVYIICSKICIKDKYTIYS